MEPLAPYEDGARPQLAAEDFAERACDPANAEPRTTVRDERSHDMASVIVTTGDQKGEFLPLGRRISVIGRAENLPLQVRDDLVSRKHLRIRFEEETGDYFAEDMGSHNGVYINNRRIEERTRLAEGDMILIGATFLMFTQKDFDDKDS